MIKWQKKITDSGFTLVAVLLMMVLLLTVAVGMISLATISLRNGTHEEANSRARANAITATCLISIWIRLGQPWPAQSGRRIE